jgi:hypothetical protein
MSDTVIRANLKTTVESVSNIGNVYDYLRWTALYDDFLVKVKDTIGGTDLLRLWMITSAGFDQAENRGDDIESIAIPRTHHYRIFGYGQVDDANGSEKTFYTLTEAVVNVLNLNAVTLTNLPTAIIENVSIAQLGTFEHRMFGSVLCHFARIDQDVTEIATKVN